VTQVGDEYIIVQLKSTRSNLFIHREALFDEYGQQFVSEDKIIEIKNPKQICVRKCGTYTFTLAFKLNKETKELEIHLVDAKQDVIRRPFDPKTDKYASEMIRFFNGEKENEYTIDILVKYNGNLVSIVNSNITKLYFYGKEMKYIHWPGAKWENEYNAYSIQFNWNKRSLIKIRSILNHKLSVAGRWPVKWE